MDWVSLMPERSRCLFQPLDYKPRDALLQAPDPHSAAFQISKKVSHPSRRLDPFVDLQTVLPLYTELPLATVHSNPHFLEIRVALLTSESWKTSFAAPFLSLEHINVLESRAGGGCTSYCKREIWVSSSAFSSW